MKLSELKNIKKLYFGYEELARAFGISVASARVTASRYVSKGLLVRIKRNVYVLREVWKTATKEDRFVMANLGQVPSYLSLMTALDYYGITTQMQRDFFESVAIQRTKTLQVEETVFKYSKISKNLYFGFNKNDTFFIASPEKALLDAFYLMSFGRYALDISSIDPAKLNKTEIQKLSRQYPQRTKNLLMANGYL
jgi:predicted transcriptional regulator of viral defense system